MSASADDSYDPDYEPPEDEILEYAQWLGMDLETEKVSIPAHSRRIMSFCARFWKRRSLEGKRRGKNLLLQKSPRIKSVASLRICANDPPRISRV